MLPSVDTRRWAAVAVVAVAVILLSNGTSYQVHAIFQNASQIVSGDQVEVAGPPIGTVSSLALTRDGEADLTLNITNSNYDPLRQGTQATVRELSLSGIASRYVDIHSLTGGLGSRSRAPLRSVNCHTRLAAPEPTNAATAFMDRVRVAIERDRRKNRRGSTTHQANRCGQG